MKRRTVEEVMTTEVVTVAEDAPFTEIAETLADRRISAVPVLDAGGRVTGVVTEADLLRKEEFRPDDLGQRPLRGRRRHHAFAKARAVDARGLMSAPAVTVEPGATVAEAARLLASRGFKAAPVVDGDGVLRGIVARRDLLSVFHRGDDDIRDEIVVDVLVCRLWQDPSEVSVQVRDGVVRLSGRLELKSLIPVLVRMTAATEGVVDVIGDLSYERDDTRFSGP
ncbi:CBS domain-containing protein [Actinomadura verrucosospora]|uniref:CBS domain containing membrane protein n=1 Tax=Actinomadura verrucosospora TaxID=46165 RepID=A0A7D4A7P3_ACTVE|nr:CBS domain-containing protein [Actinomadura verrucosospora]QKG27124.1 CBS domain containing membrane protein [Actinomadura verrucosospora]